MSKEKDILISKVSKIWGGRFKQNNSKLMRDFNASIEFDKRLCFHDLELSRVHSNVLANKKIITSKENVLIQKGLKLIEREIKNNKFSFTNHLEDIHMHIEYRLTELIGDVGKKLHTARSRNDQVVTAFKMYVKDELKEVDNLLKDLQGALIEQADLHIDSAMPGFTHLQIAQPIILAHHLLAYVEMFGRDRERTSDALNRMNKSPLGAAALAGTSFPIDNKKTSKLLGFREPMENSMDAVSDRDFVFDSLSLASIAMVHLSRLSEEIILWSSPGFGFVELPDSFSTGSSIMPQKKNPDSAELIRGKTGRVSSAFFNVLTMMKGLPLAYSKDMQEDKEAFFDAYDNLFKCLKVAEGLMKALKFKPKAMKKMLTLDHITATDLADWLVRDFNIPFREAHSITGKIVNLAEKKNIRLKDLKLNELKNIDERINNKVFEVLSLNSSLKSKKSLGGTAPILVKKALSKAKIKWLGR